MAKPFKNLVEKMSPENRARAEKLKLEILRDLSLKELRAARELTQKQLAKKLRVSQAAVSKMERQSDVYISTLRRCLRVMGYTLEIVARAADGEAVTINQFEEVARRKAVGS
jgi:transcriptional regulator with XRE-family HTH domain